MLCRTANELYWMARHIERAENTARLLDVTYRTSLLPYQVQAPGLGWAEPWAVPLLSTGLATGYYERYPELSAENVKRVVRGTDIDPFSDEAQSPYEVTALMEFKTVWHPMGA